MQNLEITLSVEAVNSKGEPRLCEVPLKTLSRQGLCLPFPTDDLMQLKILGERAFVDPDANNDFVSQDR